LPTQVFKLSIQGWWEGGKELGERTVPPKTRDNPYIQLHADQEYVLCVKPQVGCKTSHANAPRFPRPKDVGWFMILGLDSECELLALKRTPANNRAVNLSFTTPSTLGKAVLTLYIISSCYLGIDQQYDLHIEVIEPSIEAQFNTETSN
jgi:activating signal cointegrator complex subunit 3